MGVAIGGSELAWLRAAEGMIMNMNGDGYAISKQRPDWSNENPDDPEHSGR